MVIVTSTKYIDSILSFWKVGSKKVFAIPRDVQPSAKKRHRSSDEEDFSLGDRLDARDGFTDICIMHAI